MAKDRDSSSATGSPDGAGIADARGSEPAADSAAPSTSSTIPADVAALGYEQARDELAAIVATLESGRAGLEESMTLWQRGEALAKHCAAWLDAAEARLNTGS